ncbi:MAG: hypothetical protein AB6733_16365 [Clostridiaceae bacterium]
MDLTKNTELLVVLFYIVLISVVKKFYINKKYDLKTSNFIYDCLSALITPYFLFIGQYFLAGLWVVVFLMKLYAYKRK